MRKRRRRGEEGKKGELKSSLNKGGKGSKRERE
jgi:hypothetical protein